MQKGHTCKFVILAHPIATPVPHCLKISPMTLEKAQALGKPLKLGQILILSHRGGILIRLFLTQVFKARRF